MHTKHQMCGAVRSHYISLLRCLFSNRTTNHMQAASTERACSFSRCTHTRCSVPFFLSFISCIPTQQSGRPTALHYVRVVCCTAHFYADGFFFPHHHRMNTQNTQTVGRISGPITIATNRATCCAPIAVHHRRDRASRYALC